MEAEQRPQLSRHTCAHISLGRHLLGLSIVPPQRMATARGFHWQPAGTPRCCGFIHQEALELVTVQRDSLGWALCLEAGRHLRRCLLDAAIAQDLHLPWAAPNTLPYGQRREDPDATF